MPRLRGIARNPAQRPSLVREAIGVQHRHMGNLLRIRDVVGTGVGLGEDGKPVIKVYTTGPGVPGFRATGVCSVKAHVTGRVVALGDTNRPLPASPPGRLNRHPSVTAGTIGARVKDADGRVYALSNNHVYANQNDAAIGDSALQPGVFDGGSDTYYYRVGTLAAYQPIDFSLSGVNYMDAAIVLSDTGNLGNSTLPDGYGTPSSDIAAAYVGLPVKKYGRTTGETHGQVAEINVYVEVCYEQLWIFCIKSLIFMTRSPSPPGDSATGGTRGPSS